MVDNVLLLQPCAARLLYPHNSTSSICGRDNDFYSLEKVHAGIHLLRVPSVSPLFFYPLGTLVLYQTHVAIVNSFCFHYRQK